MMYDDTHLTPAHVTPAPQVTLAPQVTPAPQVTQAPHVGRAAFGAFAQKFRRRVVAGFVAVAALSGLALPGSAVAECTTSELPSTDTVQSVEQVFDEVSRRWGQIIRADLTAQGIGNLCIWVYEIKLLSSSGEVTNVVYDASKLRMIGFNTPQVAEQNPEDGSVLRSIGQRFGFFGRRDPTSEGRGDSDRGDSDGQSTASSNNDGDADNDSTTDTATDSGTADATDDGDDKAGPASSADEGDGSSGHSGNSSGGSSDGGSGSSPNSSGSSNSNGSTGSSGSG